MSPEMAILLDTNVVSELMRPVPNATVEVWLSRYDKSDFYLASVSEAELRYGNALLPSGRRKERLKTSMEAMLQRAFQDRVLSFDRKSAHTYAENRCFAQI